MLEYERKKNWKEKAIEEGRWKMKGNEHILYCLVDEYKIQSKKKVNSSG